MRPKIMIVDDAAFMRTMFREILQDLKYEVIAEATNGLEAVESYKIFKPDLVTMDITMPEMDGIEALKEIRKFDPKAQVIMCSAIGQQSLVVESIHAGAVDFWVKPVSIERISNSLRRWTIKLNEQL